MILSRAFEERFPRLLHAINHEACAITLNHGGDIEQEVVSRYQSLKWIKYRASFLRFMVPQGSLDNGLLNLFSAADLRKNQTDLAPLCNTDNDYGVIAFADWTGQSDGDLWVLDLNDGNVGALGLGTDVDTYEELKRGFYLQFSSPEHWLQFLAVEAFRRDWIDAKLLRELVT